MTPPAAITLPPLPEELKTVPRPVLVDTIARMIDHLDERDPEPDLEPCGDEEDHSRAEDEFVEHGSDGQAGCPVADPAEQDDPPEDDEGGGDTSGDENEPDFSRPRAGYGPGCAISDSDYGAEEAGEPEIGT